MKNSEQQPSPGAATTELEYRRRNIDRIDRTIVALLAERVRVGCEIGALKHDLDTPTRVPEREADVIAHVRRAAGGRLSPQSAERIFNVIIEETVAAQAGGHGDD